MRALELERVSLSLGAFALRAVDVALAPGEVLVLLGANGAGKSVLLETIAGFHAPTAGRNRVGGRDVTREPPERRGVGFMVQNFGLFPHLTVAANVGFPARAKTGGRNVAALLQRFGVAHVAERTPGDLSPGEKQRVALARALASRPDVFLFDEPFAAIDARTCEILRDELNEFLRDAGLAAIFVSHDATDVHVLADRVAVIAGGALQQVGSVEDVFSRPKNRCVAECVGVENILSGAAAARLRPEWAEATLCLRAEDVVVLPRGEGRRGDDGAIWLEAVVRRIVRLGPIARVTVDCGFPLAATLARADAERLAVASPASVRVAREVLHCLAGDQPAA